MARGETARETRIDEALWDWRNLHAMMAAEKHGSFTRAAEALGVTQSVVSRRILKLEAALQTVLFERLRSGVRPTRVGRHFSRQVRRALDLIERSAGELRKLGPAP